MSSRHEPFGDFLCECSRAFEILDRYPPPDGSYEGHDKNRLVLGHTWDESEANAYHAGAPTENMAAIVTVQASRAQAPAAECAQVSHGTH